MTYEQLHDFIDSRMRMSHIYQPVMLMALLSNQGRCHEQDIAKAILAHDQSQIEYYTQITNNMVGRVLRNHDIVDRELDTRNYVLNCYDKLTDEQITDLIQLCQQKLEAFLDTRGETVFQHRRRSSGYLSGTLKYDVLKRAQFHCELCGIPADKKALEVDHIVPLNKGGTDDLNNLQALCYSCNAMKRDRDDTDFHAIRQSYAHREPDCLFCEIPAERIVAENELTYAISDAYPVTEGHTLVIPKRHVATFFELGQAEINACTLLLQKQKAALCAQDSSIQGFNIGMNNGECAGQTIFHCHIHLIPRRDGDTPEPRGGVRHVIPGKGCY